MGAGVELIPPTPAPGLPRTLWQFTRPHTITATTASVLTLWVVSRTSDRGGLEPSVVMLLVTLAVCVATNVYITGINQVVDVDIDRINKPWLPVASGALSRRSGMWLSIGLGAGALVVASFLSLALTVTVALGLLVGSAYSIPPLRLKRFPVAAALSITAVRGPVLTFGVYLHFAGGRSVPGSVWLLAVTAAAFGLVVAVLKDLPDRRGDTAYGIRTFSNTGDVRVVHRVAMGVLVVTYVGAALCAPFLGGLVGWVLVVGELACAGLATWVWRSTDPTSAASAAHGYRWVWRTYYLHHVAVAAAALATLA